MDQSGLQARINRGYGKAARRLGAAVTVYRPDDLTAPLAAGAPGSGASTCRLGPPLGTLLAKFDIDPAFSHRAPSKYGSALSYLLADASMLLPGDYLVSDQGTWFVAGMEPNVPPLCVACNRTVTVERPVAQAGAGALGYGGRGLPSGFVPGTPSHDVPGTPSHDAGWGPGVQGRETTIAAGLPVSILTRTKGEANVSGLPGDVRSTWVEVLMPPLLGPRLASADEITDDLGRRYVLAAPEATNLGVRVLASYAGA